MYLKRLDLHGFKSFAPATSFEFGPGVTCIAGPNGAGKTNVAEAIRWVLGEHASRVIRARKTEDIVFSGSAKRPAMGMAEVRLTLDNSDGWLPLDFEEVVVSRRAFRSGDNEYYINQSRVRLKDVTELFLKAQVGQNSYAFMGQGLVEQVLTLRPEERRGLIEEAAEVRLHRDKLEEARNRLAATRDNLARVELLVAEIAPRLRQLERQANRAASYAQLSGELADALRTLFGNQWQDAQEALAAARAACDQRQGAFEQARQQVTACEEGLASLATAIDERRRDIAAREASHRHLEDYLRDLERRLAIDSERRTMLTARREELDGEVMSLEAQREQLASHLAQLDRRLADLDAELTKARAPEALSEELTRVEARLADVRPALEQTEADAGRSAGQAIEAESRRDALTNHQERLRHELDTLTAARGEQLTALKAWALEFAQRLRRVSELRPPTLRDALALKEARARLDDLTTRVTERREQVRRLEIDIESGERRLAAAQDPDVEMPAPDAAVRALLAAGGRVPQEEPSPDNRIEGLVGVIGEIIRVPEGLERAIEAALADALHGVVVETQDDALAAVELLVSEDLGRATVFPLSDLKPVHPVNLMDERGVIGVAAQLVRCEQRYRPLVNALLGRTIVVENIGIAKVVLRRGLGNVVTRDGALLQPVGSITAGSAKPVRQALALRRDVGDLPRDLQSWKASHREAAGALEREERELADAQANCDRLAPNVDRMEAELGQAQAALESQRGRLSPIAARLVALNARRLDLLQAADSAARAVVEVQEEAERARVAAGQQAEALEQLRHEVEELSASRETLVQKTAGRSGLIASLESEQASFREQQSMQQAAVSRFDDELARRRDLIARVTEEVAALTARIDATQHELDEKSRETDAAREELDPARHSLQQLESRRHALEDELTAARANAIETERALLDAETTVRLRSEELDALRDRLAEEGFQASPEGEIVAVEDTQWDDDEDGPPQWLAAERARDDELPPMRGGAEVDTVALRERITTLRNSIRRLGPVNEQAEADYAENKERHDYLSAQLTDLREAEGSLERAIEELEGIIKERFTTTFHKVNEAFRRYFETFFGGGHAELQLTPPDDRGFPGIDIIAQPPRKRVRTLNMLSGGERSLTAVALLFALLDTHPSPICVLDEVDAALDEANVGRFTQTLRELAERTQFIIITHNRRTLEMADTIYGVSMGEDSTSTVLSLRFADIAKH